MIDNNKRLLILGKSGGGGVQSDWTETDETADSYIKNKPTLNFVPMETYNTLLERIAKLEVRIEALENPIVEEPTPDPEIPEEPVE